MKKEIIIRKTNRVYHNKIINIYTIEFGENSAGGNWKKSWLYG